MSNTDTIPISDMLDLGGVDETIELSEFAVPDSMIFGYPTRLVDAWKPDIERLHMPGFVVPACPTKVTVRRGVAKPSVGRIPGPGQLSRRLKQRVKRYLHHRIPSIDRSELLIYDSRWKDTSNIAHIIEHIMSRIALAKRVIANHCGASPDITVVLPGKASAMTKRVFEFAEIPTICTNGPVIGTIVDVECDLFYGLLPLLSNLKIPDYISHTPKRVFISRRKSRVLLNEDEVVDFLTSQGFQRVYFEDLPLNEQWSIAKNATDIVAIHGAALGALAFKQRATPANGGFRLTELFGAGFVVDPFRRFTAILGGSWVAVRSQIEPKIIRDIDFRGDNFRHAYAPFRVDIDCVAHALKYHDCRLG